MRLCIILYHNSSEEVLFGRASGSKPQNHQFRLVLKGHTTVLHLPGMGTASGGGQVSYKGASILVSRNEML